MIIDSSELHFYSNLQERVEDYMLENPCVTRRTGLDSYDSGFLPWHWHSCFECIAVEKGELELIVERGTHRIKAGDGCFINADVLHCFRPADGQKGVLYHVHQFSREFIGGLGTLDRKYVFPVCDCGGLDVLALSRGDERQGKMLSLIETAYECAGAEPFGFELQIRVYITELWLLLLEAARNAIRDGRKVSSADSDRIKQMLTYIENNLSDAVTPRDIARAAGVSVRECHRCFQKVLGQTPVSYVNDRRISQSLRLLRDTGDSVTQISEACGFSTSSYFAKCFRDKMRVTPMEYRKGINKASPMY